MVELMDEKAEINSTKHFLTLDNPVFGCYLFWASILVLKMLLMTLLTIKQRFSTKTFVNPEDLTFRKVPEAQLNNPDVERVRRAHLNDIENVLPFLLAALFYTATGPNAILARILFRIAAISRIVHTAVYAFRPVPQPTRSIAFFITYGITLYMVFYIIVRTIKRI